MSEQLVHMGDVTKVYRQGDVEVHALRGLDLTVDRGEFVALWGPSGSGKTTALNLIGALDTPTSGSITLDELDLDGCVPSERPVHEYARLVRDRADGHHHRERYHIHEDLGRSPCLDLGHLAEVRVAGAPHAHGVFALRGGMSAELAVQKCLASLTASVSYVPHAPALHLPVLESIETLK